VLAQYQAFLGSQQPLFRTRVEESVKENRMSKGLEVIDHSVQLTHEWINELADVLDWADQRQVLQLLRSVLTGIRDHLPHEESAGFAAQLPILLRGMYYEGWRPATTPEKDRSKESFVGKVQKNIKMDLEYGGEEDIASVMRFLSGKVSAGEISDVRSALPPKIRSLWPD
jgi:uncharacterized protein (DUF2267 family)